MGENTKPQMGPWQGRDWLLNYVCGWQNQTMMILIRNGNGHAVPLSVTQWKITRVFSEHDEALINRKLPKELLLRVFSYLDIISLCRSAQVLSLTPTHGLKWLFRWASPGTSLPWTAPTGSKWTCLSSKWMWKELWWKICPKDVGDSSKV